MLNRDALCDYTRELLAVSSLSLRHDENHRGSPTKPDGQAIASVRLYSVYITALYTSRGVNLMNCPIIAKAVLRKHYKFVKCLKAILLL